MSFNATTISLSLIVPSGEPSYKLRKSLLIHIRSSRQILEVLTLIRIRGTFKTVGQLGCLLNLGLRQRCLTLRTFSCLVRYN